MYFVAYLVSQRGGEQLDQFRDHLFRMGPCGVLGTTHRDSYHGSNPGLSVISQEVGHCERCKTASFGRYQDYKHTEVAEQGDVRAAIYDEGG